MLFKRIRDPLHSLIEFDIDDAFDNALWKVIQTSPFQRLRRIKQLGFSDMVYPGATHARFSHCLGAYHIAKKLTNIIEHKLGNAKSNHIKSSIAASLLHDIGHGPFSHAFEEVGKKYNIDDHETIGDHIIQTGEVAEALDSYFYGFHRNVAEMIRSDYPTNIYGAVVSSQFDADRLDYIQRDRLMAGTCLGAIDFDWLLDNLEVGTIEYGTDELYAGKIETLVIGAKAVHAAESYILGLFQLYPNLYFHKATRGMEKIFSEILKQIFMLVKGDLTEKTGLSSSHPLIKYAKNPNLENYLLLDDTVVWGALSMMTDAQDLVIANFSRRMRDRKIYKCIDITERLLEAHPSPLESQRRKAVLAVLPKRLKKLAQNYSTPRPQLLIDSLERSPYKFGSEKGPLGQIHVKTAARQLEDLGTLSPIVKAIEPFERLRVYIDRDNTTLPSVIDRCLDTTWKSRHI